jgi:uncharacterized coiled-coil protein SlyX
MTIPDWAWKVLQLLVIPVALWAIATHVSAKSMELRMAQVEQKISLNEKQLTDHNKDISETKQDIAILKVRMEYVAQGIDDIKKMLEDQNK